LIKKIKKELLKNPQALLERTLELEAELIKLRKNYSRAIKYMRIALRRIDPNKVRQQLNKEFYELYKSYYHKSTHQKATEQLLQDPSWHLYCKLDPMLARLKTPKAFKEKFNSLKKKLTVKI